MVKLLMASTMRRVYGLVSWWRMSVRALCASAIVLQGCGVDTSTTAATVTPTGYDVGSSLFGPEIAWVDNNQVLFIGQKSNLDPKERSYAAFKMYIWNESTKSVREHADAAHFFCYADSRIRYGYGKKDEAGNTIIHEGPLGKEEIITVPLAPSHALRGFSYFSCKLYSSDDFVPPIPKDRQTLVLREGDGYLVLQPTGSARSSYVAKNLILYRGKGAEPVTLPMTWYGNIGLLTPQEITYSAYLRAYVLHQPTFESDQGPRDWPASEPRVVYVLRTSDGSVERVTIPPTTPFKRPKSTKVGWIYAGGLVRDGKWVGHNGLYLYDGNRQKKIEAGTIGAITVSPDGCKAAVAVNNYSHIPMLGTPTTLKIFNFCAVTKR